MSSLNPKRDQFNYRYIICNWQFEGKLNTRQTLLFGFIWARKINKIELGRSSISIEPIKIRYLSESISKNR